MKISFCFFILFTTTLLFGQEVDRSQNRLLWEISGNGLNHPAYLYGSFHNNSKAIFEFPDSVLWALDQADAVLLETSITEMMNRVDVRESNQWRDLYSNGISDRPAKTGYGDDSGEAQFIDMYFQEVADNCDKLFFPLEKVSDQMKLATLPKKLKDDVNLKAITKEFSKFDMEDSYLRGDIEELFNFTKKSSEIYEGFYEALLPDRNHIMANGLDTLIHQHKVFCAVGAAHLSGEEGVIQLLKNKGYTLRPVVPVYSKKLNEYKEKFKKCDGYMYRDELYGFKVRLNGKPKITEEEGARSFSYQELGQGNSYNMQIRYLEMQTDPDEFAKSFFVSQYGDTTEYLTMKLKDGTNAFEGIINKGTTSAMWIRSFTRNDISYLMYSRGGPKFMKSSRPSKYFDQFEFLSSDLYDITGYDTISSATKTLEIILPEGGATTQEETDILNWWKHIYFNPASGESYYVYETILTGNNIYVHSDDYGEYLLDEYDLDSIQYHDSIVEENYLQRSFTAKVFGKTSHGIMKREGNVLQFAQYKGENAVNREKFLSSFTRKDFEGPQELKSLRRSTFSTKVPLGGFKPLRNEVNKAFLKYRHYVLSDANNATTYEVKYTKLKPWAFVENDLKDIFKSEMQWPNKNYSSEIDTVFNLQDSVPSMEFTVHHNEAQTTTRGKSFISGKEIITYQLSYPKSLKEDYSNVYFLDSIKLNNYETPSVHSYTIEGLQQLLNGNKKEQYQVLDFFYYTPFVPKTAKKLLLELQNLDIVASSDDEFRATPRYYLSYRLDSSQVDDELYNYWLKHSKTASASFNTTMLRHFGNHASEGKYMTNALNHILQEKIRINNPYQFLDLMDRYPERFKMNWEQIQQLLKGGQNPPSAYYADLITLANNPFYSEYIQSKKFAKISLKKKNQDWVKTRYFEALLAAKADQNFIHKKMKKWKNPTSAFENGGKIAIEHVLNGNINVQRKGELENTICAMRYTEVLNRMQTKNLYKENFSYLEYLGYLGLETIISNGSIRGYNALAFDKTITITDYKNEERTYAVYSMERYEEKYQFVIQLPGQEIIPTQSELDNTLYILGQYQEQSDKRLVKELKELIKIEEGRN